VVPVGLRRDPATLVTFLAAAKNAVGLAALRAGAMDADLAEALGNRKGARARSSARRLRSS